MGVYDGAGRFAGTVAAAGSPVSNSTHWSNEETKLLIRTWAERRDEFAETKRNLSVWNKVLDRLLRAGYFRSIEQCRNRWKFLEAKYKTAQREVRAAGRTSWEFYDDVDRAKRGLYPPPATTAAVTAVRRERSGSGSSSSAHHDVQIRTADNPATRHPSGSLFADPHGRVHLPPIRHTHHTDSPKLLFQNIAPAADDAALRVRSESPMQAYNGPAASAAGPAKSMPASGSALARGYHRQTPRPSLASYGVATHDDLPPDNEHRSRRPSAPYPQLGVPQSQKRRLDGSPCTSAASAVPTTSGAAAAAAGVGGLAAGLLAGGPVRATGEVRRADILDFLREQSALREQYAAQRAEERRRAEELRSAEDWHFHEFQMSVVGLIQAALLPHATDPTPDHPPDAASVASPPATTQSPAPAAPRSPSEANMMSVEPGSSPRCAGTRT